MFWQLGFSGSAPYAASAGMLSVRLACRNSQGWAGRSWRCETVLPLNQSAWYRKTGMLLNQSVNPPFFPCPSQMGMSLFPRPWDMSVVPWLGWSVRTLRAPLP